MEITDKIVKGHHIHFSISLPTHHHFDLQLFICRPHLRESCQFYQTNDTKSYLLGSTTVPGGLKRNDVFPPPLSWQLLLDKKHFREASKQLQVHTDLEGNRLLNSSQSRAWKLAPLPGVSNSTAAPQFGT